LQHWSIVVDWNILAHLKFVVRLFCIETIESVQTFSFLKNDEEVSCRTVTREERENVREREREREKGRAAETGNIWATDDDEALPVDDRRETRTKTRHLRPEVTLKRQFD
jgi:hypothetical protein